MNKAFKILQSIQKNWNVFSTVDTTNYPYVVSEQTSTNNKAEDTNLDPHDPMYFYMLPPLNL